MILVINTAQNDNLSLVLLQEKEILRSTSINAKHKQSDKLLVEIDKLLKKDVKKLSHVVVVSGPGSFTSLRIGVVVGNTLAWSLGLPLAELSLDEFNNDDFINIVNLKVKKAKKGFIAEPVYDRGPNITKKK